MKKTLSLALVTALTIGTFTTLRAATNNCLLLTSNAATTSKDLVEGLDATKISENGFLAMRSMHAARMAIFNGEIENCETLLKKAEELMAQAHEEFEVETIPIDGQLRLADTFVASGEKEKFVAAANEHFMRGNRQAGMEQLKLGEVEVNFSRVLMPYEATRKRLEQARRLTGEKKYYEANLALKAASDGLVFDTVSLIDTVDDASDDKGSEEKDK